MTPVGTTEIAAMLGVSRQRAHVLAARPDFPSPLGTVGQSRIWDAAAVEAWHLARRGPEAHCGADLEACIDAQRVDAGR